jgi:DNA-binding NarL/FixJ family response regulator
MHPSPIRVVVADDHPVVREGVAAILADQSDITVVGQAEDGESAIASYRAHRPDVMMMDLQMPRVSGLEAITRIRAEFPEARIIVLTTYAGDAQALGALRAGAVGYLLKNTLRRELVEAVRSVHNGGKHLNAEVATGIALHATQDRLTARESAVLQYAAAGNSNKQIAAHLFITEETVKGHMKAIFGKLGAADRTHAVTIAAKRGIIEL